LLDEVVAVTGLHRKAAIRLLRRAPRAPTVRARAGRPRLYGPAVAAAVAVLWQATGHIGPHRLQPFVPELLDRLTREGELTLAPEVDKRVRQVSPATLGRLLAPARATRPPRGATTTRVGTWLRHEIPIRTFTEWDDAGPGFFEVDLVAHCGSSTKDFYLCTLCAVDIATAWVELEAIWGKRHERVGGGVHRVRQRLPMPLLGLDSDNGSEFINQSLYDYCRQGGITFTRSRAWKKNDSAHVEQKNGAVVRQLIGYDRFASKAAYAQLARVYRLARCTSTSSSPYRSSCANTGTARACTVSMTGRRRRIIGSAPPACCRPASVRISRRSINASTRSSSGATSTRPWTASGPWPPPIRTARGIPRSPPPPRSPLLRVPRRWLR